MLCLTRRRSPLPLSATAHENLQGNAHFRQLLSTITSARAACSGRVSCSVPSSRALVDVQESTPASGDALSPVAQASRPSGPDIFSRGKWRSQLVRKPAQARRRGMARGLYAANTARIIFAVVALKILHPQLSDALAYIRARFARVRATVANARELRGCRPLCSTDEDSEAGAAFLVMELLRTTRATPTLAHAASAGKASRSKDRVTLADGFSTSLQPSRIPPGFVQSRHSSPDRRETRTCSSQKRGLVRRRSSTFGPSRVWAPCGAGHSRREIDSGELLQSGRGAPR
jgi:hypothetical protein